MSNICADCVYHKCECQCFKQEKCRGKCMRTRNKIKCYAKACDKFEQVVFVNKYNFD